MFRPTNIFYKEKGNWILTVFWNSLYIAFFLLPLGINLPTPFFIISIVLGLINLFTSPRNFFLRNKALLLLPLYFVVLAISLIYTDDLSAGTLLLIRSLSLLFFPIIFLFVKEDAATVKKLFDFLLLGLMLSFVINFSMAIYDAISIVEGNIVYGSGIEWVYSFLNAIINGWNHFIGVGFSKLVNPSYISLYILLVLSYYLKNKLTSRLQLSLIHI